MDSLSGFVAEAGSKAEAARRLGIPVSTLKDRLAKESRLVGGVPNEFEPSRLSTRYKPDGELAGYTVSHQPSKPTLKDKIEQVKAELAGIAPREPVEAPVEGYAELLTLYPFFDPHFGERCWGRETGQNWDLELAEAAMLDTASYLIGRSEPSETAILLGGGDNFHANDATGQTPKSKHILEVDGRHPKVIHATTRAWVTAVEMALHRHRRVKVRILPGNHDPDAYLVLVYALYYAFRDNTRVSVDLDPSAFWFYSFGKVLLGATHGDKTKHKDLPQVMATEAAHLWGPEQYRYFFTGHIHRQTGWESGGVYCRSLPSLAPRGAYAAGKGLSSLTGSSAFVFHKDEGQVAEYSKLRPLVERAA